MTTLATRTCELHAFSSPICTVKLDTHIDMLIENKIGNLAWDGNLTAVKIEGESMKEIFLLGFKSNRKKIHDIRSQCK